MRECKTSGLEVFRSVVVPTSRGSLRSPLRSETEKKTTDIGKELVRNCKDRGSDSKGGGPSVTTEKKETDGQRNTEKIPTNSDLNPGLGGSVRSYLMSRV